MIENHATPSGLPERPLSSSLRVAVVGTGALGSAVCRLLMLRGQADVLLVDPDTVAPRNLSLSRLFERAGSRGLHRAKVEVIQELALEHGLKWRALQAEVADVGLARLALEDVVISCTDSTMARVETALIARSLRLPMLDGAVKSSQIPEGRVSWLASPDDAACSLCGLPEGRRGEMLAEALSRSLSCLPPVQVEAMTGAMTTVEVVAATLVRVLESKVSHTSFSLRLRTGSTEERIDLTRSLTCPWHTLPHPGELICLPPNLPVRVSLVCGGVLELPWPICLRARCLRCGETCEPRLRVARVRRTLRCAACGEAGCIQPIETVQRLTAGHPLAGWTPRRFGLPEEHLYHRRRAMFARGAAKPDLP